MREICLVRLDKTRPALVLTREAARAAMTKVTVAPITSTIKGLSSEVAVGPDNGLDPDCVVSLDNVLTVPVTLLGRTVGFLTPVQEEHLARAVVLAFDLDDHSSTRTLDHDAAKRYFRRRDIRRSASGLPPVWQVAQYCNEQSANDTSRTVSPHTGRSHRSGRAPASRRAWRP